MPRYAAFLRGINLGGRRLTNERLRGCFEQLGLDEVATFRASGNVIFGAGGGEAPDALARRIEHGLADALGWDVPVFLRTAAQMRAIAAHEPFSAAELAASKGRVQVALLADRPSAAVRERALALATEDDRLALAGAELYWLPRGRMSDSTLDLDALGRMLGPFTIRTKGTVDQIAARWFAP
jgi:uncharacterized protein (DUF1697 family)